VHSGDGLTVAASLMAPFTALRPAPERARDVAARPYDVVSLEEARDQAAGRPFSFLHVSRAEIDLAPGTDPHAPEVYAQAAAAFSRMCRDGVLIEDESPSFYVVRITTANHEQTGVAAAGSISAYRANRIRRHELTRPDKERDRVRQIEAVRAQTGPVLAAHPVDPALDAILDRATAGEPVADAETPDGARHRVWRIDDPSTCNVIEGRFDAMAAIYIADGHHRSAAATRVAEARAAASDDVQNDDDRFLVVSFPVDQLRILDYNRIVRDLNGLTASEFLARLERVYDITPVSEPVRPPRPQRFGLFVDGHWYALAVRTPPSADATPVDRLDVNLLQQTILAPILGIGDPRTDPRIDFLGGGRGLGALETAVRDGGFAAAFSLFPTRFADIVAVADAGQVMPPKSTWFEPKLADGLLSLPLPPR
jgi:uncharacterized protein (DUF1015 family)